MEVEHALLNGFIERVHFMPTAVITFSTYDLTSSSNKQHNCRCTVNAAMVS